MAVAQSIIIGTGIFGAATSAVTLVVLRCRYPIPQLKEHFVSAWGGKAAPPRSRAIFRTGLTLAGASFGICAAVSAWSAW